MPGCKKENTNEIIPDPFENTAWRATLTDENPASNPSGGFGEDGSNKYYSWLNCNLDDVFSFKNNALTINNNGTRCENDFDLIFGVNTQSYSYNDQSKTLTLGSGDNVIDLQVFELNNTRLKIGVAIPSATGFGYLMLIFKRQ